MWLVVYILNFDVINFHLKAPMFSLLGAVAVDIFQRKCKKVVV